MTLPIDPALYDLPADRIGPRPGPGPMELPAPPSPGFDPGLMLPEPEIDRITRLLAPFANFPLAQQVGMGRHGAPPAATFLLGVLRGAARQRLANLGQEQATRTEINRRFTSAAAERNRANLTLSRDAQQERITGLKEESKLARTARDKEQERTAGEIKVPWTGQMVARSSALGQHVAGGGTQAQWNQRSGIRPPRPPRLIGAKIGPVLPTLAAVHRDLATRADAARMFTPSVADSLQGLAGAVDDFHARLREAQTSDEVDALSVPDNLPAQIGASLAAAIRTRKHQLGNGR